MGKEPRRFKDINKLFGMDPTSGSDDFEDNLATLISEVVRLNECFIHRQNEINSNNLKLLQKIADKLIIIDRRITDIEYEIFESDEDTTLD